VETGFARGEFIMWINPLNKMFSSNLIHVRFRIVLSREDVDYVDN